MCVCVYYWVTRDRDNDVVEREVPIRGRNLINGTLGREGTIGRSVASLSQSEHNGAFVWEFLAHCGTDLDFLQDFVDVGWLEIKWPMYN